MEQNHSNIEDKIKVIHIKDSGKIVINKPIYYSFDMTDTNPLKHFHNKNVYH